MFIGGWPEVLSWLSVVWRRRHLSGCSGSGALRTQDSTSPEGGRGAFWKGLSKYPSTQDNLKPSLVHSSSNIWPPHSGFGIFTPILLISPEEAKAGAGEEERSIEQVNEWWTANRVWQQATCMFHSGDCDRWQVTFEPWVLHVTCVVGGVTCHVWLSRPLPWVWAALDQLQLQCKC